MKKQKNKQAIKASKLAKAQNMQNKIITDDKNNHMEEKDKVFFNLFKELSNLNNDLIESKKGRNAVYHQSLVNKLFIELRPYIDSYFQNNTKDSQNIRILLDDIDSHISFPLIWDYNPDVPYQSVKEVFLGKTFLLEDEKIKRENNKTVDCVFISDEGYVNMTLIAINSIRKSKLSTTSIRIFIVAAALSKEAEEKFKLWEEKDFSINIIRVDEDLLKKLSKLHKYEEKGFCMATPAALLKFFLPKIFSNLNKILYLDGDVIVRKDLKELFDTPLGNYYVAAVTDAWTLVNDNPQIRRFGRWLFNSGVMLLNLKKQRENNICEILLEAKAKCTDYSLMDQHILNSIFAGNVLFLPYKYNALPIWYFRHNSKFEGEIWKKKANLFYGKSIQRKENFVDDSVVIAHFAGSDKPWVNNNVPFALEWSIHKDDVIKKMLTNQKQNSSFVSIVIPVYNAEKYLRQCLDSVVNQTLRNIEIICIDDKSTDNSLQILQEYAQKDNRLKIVKNKKNLGSAASRNKGVLLAKGEYIGFVDSDDYISLDYYKNLLEKAILFYADISATSKAYVFSEDGKGFYKNLGLNNKSIISNNIDKGNIIITTGVSCNKIYKKSFLTNNNIKCMEIKNAAEDNYFTDCAIIKASKIAVSHDSIYYYRNNANSQTKKLKDESQFSMIHVYSEIDNFIIKQNFPKKIEEEWQSIINRRKKIDFDEFMKTMQPNCRKEFKRLFKKAFPTINNDIIISLTSYPARINTVNQTIESLLNQTMKADKVILWLAPEQFPNKEKDLPPQLLELKEKGLTIDWYHDIKSYKKLIPTLKKYPDAIIVTADDDIIYPKNWLEELYKSHTIDSNAIWCHRVHGIKLVNNKISNYKNWSHCLNHANTSYLIFGTTGGGILFPPHCFYKDFDKEDIFMKLAPYADDIWCWAMCILNNKKMKLVSNNMKKLNLVENTQDNALWHNNVNNGMNDIQIQAIIKEYPDILQNLKVERKKTIYTAYSKLVWNLVEYYKLKKAYGATICHQLKSLRIDIKNFGKADNDIDITTTAKISVPTWFVNEQGRGCVVESVHKKETLALKCRGSGKLRLDFRGSDKRCNGTRFPLWVDYKSIKINGKEQLSAPVQTWHDKPYRFEMPVKDGQVVTVEVVQQYHQYAKDELQDVILKLNPNSDYIRQNINRLTDKIYDKITVKSATPRVKKPKAASNQELLASIAALNARIERLEQENRAQQAQLLAAINTLKKS